MIGVLRYVWIGFWTGIGIEVSVFLTWLTWKAAHSRIAHRLGADHWFHLLSEYFE